MELPKFLYSLPTKMGQAEIIYEDCWGKGLFSHLSDKQVARKYIIKRVKLFIKHIPSANPFLTLCSLK